MRKFVSTVFALALLGAAAVSAEAHGHCGTRTPGINRRQERQQQRIGQGVRSGELTGRETLRLERNAREIRQDEREAKSDGEVTRRERAGLERELNHESRLIYRDKHNEKERN
ncbi:MAG: hypothetical protein JOZ02_16075 [Acidobacteria bacterium]|nr:hypothetical protein [Acidobacteriota bacterium]